MTDVLLVVAVMAVAAFCPLGMWSNARRGRAAACCPPAREKDAPTVADVRRRLEQLQAQIAAYNGARSGGPHVVAEL